MLRCEIFRLQKRSTPFGRGARGIDPSMLPAFPQGPLMQVKSHLRVPIKLRTCLIGGKRASLSSRLADSVIVSVIP